MDTNKVLLSSFADMFKSGNAVSIIKTIACGRIIMSAMDKSFDKKMSYSELNENFQYLINQPRFDDTFFVKRLLTLSAGDLSTIPPIMLAEVVASDAFKKISNVERQKFIESLDSFLHFTDSRLSDLEDVVFHKNSLLKILDNSDIKASKVLKSKDYISESINDFKFGISTTYLTGKLLSEKEDLPYQNVWKPYSVLDKMRSSDVKLYGPDRGNAIADSREATIHKCNSKDEKAAVEVFYMNAHDKARMAVLAAYDKKPEDYPEIFLAEKVDGSGKNAKHVVGEILATFGISTATSMGLGVIMPMLANVPVIGDFLGPILAGAFTVGGVAGEIRKAMKLAISQHRKLTTQEKLNIGINAATAALPYAAMLAGGSIGRGIGAIIMGSKSFALDIINKKANLELGKKLEFSDVAKSAGMSIAKGLAVYLGGKLGNIIGTQLTNLGNFFFGNQSITSTTDNQTQQDSTEQQHNTQESQQSFQDKTSDTNISASDKALDQLRDHKFDLTDNARSTANPEANRMYQPDASGKYVQDDWYSSNEYDRAIDVLKDAGVSDPDAALRNLAGASRYEGDKFSGALKDLLKGNLSDETVSKIFEADKILDRTGALEMPKSYTQSAGGSGAEGVTGKGVTLPSQAQNYEIVKDLPIKSSGSDIEFKGAHSPLPPQAANYDLPESDPSITIKSGTEDIKLPQASSLISNLPESAPDSIVESAQESDYTKLPESAKNYGYSRQPSDMQNLSGASPIVDSTPTNVQGNTDSASDVISSRPILPPQTNTSATTQTDSISYRLSKQIDSGLGNINDGMSNFISDVKTGEIHIPSEPMNQTSETINKDNWEIDMTKRISPESLSGLKDTTHGLSSPSNMSFEDRMLEIGVNGSGRTQTLNSDNWSPEMSEALKKDVVSKVMEEALREF